MKDKERELERVEEQGCALVQNKTDEACAIVMETLQGVNHTWANLDHLVSSGVLMLCLVWFHRCELQCSSFTDRPTEDQPEVGAGSVESLQASLGGDQRLPDGGEVLGVSVSPPHRLPGGGSAAGAESAGAFETKSTQKKSSTDAMIPYQVSLLACLEPC